MSFKTVMCVKCYATYEFYQKRHELEPCPFCGGPDHNLTSEEYYRSMGVKVKDEHI